MDYSHKPALALVLQNSLKQGRLWQVVLESQGFNVIRDSTDIDILRTIDDSKPSVALIDVSASGGQFNPFAISRESAKLSPSTAIIFTNHNRNKISNLERHYAMKQMAADLISAPKTLKELSNVVSLIIGLSGVARSFDPRTLSDCVYQVSNVEESTTLVPVTYSGSSMPGSRAVNSANGVPKAPSRKSFAMSTPKLQPVYG